MDYTPQEKEAHQQQAKERARAEAQARRTRELSDWKFQREHGRLPNRHDRRAMAAKARKEGGHA